MRKKVQIVISAKDFATSTFRKLSRTAKKELNNVTSSINRVAEATSRLTAPAAIAGGAMTMAGNNFVEAAHQAEVGGKLFNKMLNRVGENQSQVSEEIDQLADDLRLPSEVIEQNAKDLLRKGYTFKQIADIYKGAAASGMAVGRDTVSSIESVTDALVSEMSVQLNRIGIAENLDAAYQNYAESLDKTKKELNEAEKAEAVHLMVMKATKSEVEDMPEMFAGYGGAVAGWREELYKSRIELGEQLMPIWTKMYNTGSDLLSTFNSLNQEQKDSITTIAKFAGGVVGAAGALGLLGHAVQITMSGLGVLASVASVATSPIVLAGVGIAGAATLAYEAWNENWGGIHDKLSPLVDKVEQWASVEGLKKALDLTVEAGGNAWEWLKNTDIGGVVGATIDFTITAGGKAYDFVKSAITSKTAKSALDLGIKFTGKVYEDLKTGKTNSALGLVAGGLLTKMALDWTKGTIADAITKIGTAFGNSKLSKIGGGTALIATLSVGIALKEAAGEKGGFKKFGKNMAAALAAGLIAGGLTKNPNVGGLAFTVALNFKLGEKVDGLGSKFKSDILNMHMLPKGIKDNNPTLEEVLRYFGIIDAKDKHHAGAIMPGTAGPDQFPAMVAPGEAIVPARTVNAGPQAVLSWFKNMGVPGFATGKAPSGITSTFTNMSFGDMKSWLDDMKENMSTVINTLTTMFTKLIDVVVEVLNVLGNATGIKSLENIGDKIRNTIDSLIDSFKENEKANKDSADSQKEKNDNTKKTAEELGLLAELMNRFNSIMGKVNSNAGKLSSIFNQLGNITGSSRLGKVGSIFGDWKSATGSFGKFEGATGILGKISSGLGVAGAVLSMSDTINSFFDDTAEENRRQQRIWQEQIKISKQQLEATKNIEKNTAQTATNILRMVAKNPTLTNIQNAEDVVSNLNNALLNDIRPDLGDIAVKATIKEEGGWFHSDDYTTKTLKYGPAQLFRELGVKGLPSGKLNNMKFSQVDKFYNAIKNITNSDLKNYLKDDYKKDAGVLGEIFGGGFWGGILEGDTSLHKITSNLGQFKDKLKNYIDTVRDLKNSIVDMARGARMESFAGVEWISAKEKVKQYRKQVEQLYESAGKDVDEYKDQIDAMVDKYAKKMVDGGERIITIMQEVRQSFIGAFSKGNSLLDSFAQGAKTYFDSIKRNIASLFYDIELDQVNEQFEKVFGNITDKLASYKGNNVLQYAKQLLSGDNVTGLFDSIIDMAKSEGNINSINEMLAEQFRTMAEQAGLSDSKITKLLDQFGLSIEDATEKMKEFTGTTKNAPSGFKQARFGYGAATAQIDNSVNMSGNTIVIQANDPEDFYEKLEQKRKNNNLRTNGTPVTIRGG